MKNVATWLKALLAGFLAMVASIAAMLICAAAQLHTAVAILGWPIFLAGRLLSTGEPVATGSPEDPWPPLAGVLLGWLVYSSLAFFWLRQRAHGARA